jgi:hypothetical protein
VRHCAVLAVRNPLHHAPERLDRLVPYLLYRRSGPIVSSIVRKQDLCQTERGSRCRAHHAFNERLMVISPPLISLVREVRNGSSMLLFCTHVSVLNNICCPHTDQQVACDARGGQYSHHRTC